MDLLEKVQHLKNVCEVKINVHQFRNCSWIWNIFKNLKHWTNFNSVHESLKIIHEFEFLINLKIVQELRKSS